MKKILCLMVGLLCTAALFEKSFAFDEVALSDISTVAVGNIDFYATGDDWVPGHQVWLRQLCRRPFAGLELQHKGVL